MDEDSASEPQLRWFGRWEARTRLGAGGFGVAYLSVNMMGEQAVIKECTSPQLEHLLRFARESDILEALEGRYAPRLIERSTEPRGVESAWIALEFIPGETLAQRVRRTGPLTGNELNTFARDLLDAVGQIHELDISHRDLKPANLMFDASERVRVIDFGNGRRLDDATLTIDGGLLSAGFAAPEAFDRSRSHVGPPADLWSWAACLVYAASGHPPYPDENLYALYGAYAEERAPDLEGVPHDYLEAVRAGLIFDEGARRIEDIDAVLPLRPADAQLASLRAQAAELSSRLEVERRSGEAATILAQQLEAELTAARAALEDERSRQHAATPDPATVEMQFQDRLTVPMPAGDPVEYGLLDTSRFRWRHPSVTITLIAALVAVGGGILTQSVPLALALVLIVVAIRAPRMFRVARLPEFDSEVEEILIGVINDTPLSESCVPPCPLEGAAAESYKSLRSVVWNQGRQTGSKVLGVTSSVGGEGASGVAANLATALGQAGRSVLLVSAHPWRDYTERSFGIDRTPGLSDLLLGQATLDGVEHVVGNLRVIPFGSAVNDPSALLISEQARDGFPAIAHGLDQVIVELPPVLAAPEAVCAAGLIDAAIIVVDPAETSAAELAQAKAELAAVTPILGLVGNRWPADGRILPPTSRYARRSRAANRRMSALTGVPVVGQIDTFPERHRHTSTALVTVHAPSGLGADQYRRLAAMVRWKFNGQTLLVSGHERGGGRTTVAGNLAVSCAQIGLRVLLLSIDQQRAGVEELFDVPRAPGFEELLRSQATLDECERRLGDLTVIAAGNSLGSTHQLELDRVEAIEAIAQGFDLLLMDSAALDESASVLDMAGAIDGFLHVVRLDGSDSERAAHACRTLDRAGIPPFGLVMSGSH